MSANDHPTADGARLPLAGLRVVEFGQFIAAPAAGQSLADLGADVVKIEPPAGDVSRRLAWTDDDCGPMFTAFNRRKRSLVLDLKSPTARDAARSLCLAADVVLQNARPGAMERLGLGAASLMDAAPRLVYGQVSGFGRQEDSAHRPGLDIAAQAESGIMSLNGERDGDPLRVGFTVVDVLASQALCMGVMAALLRRGITGRGGLVDISLVDVATQALAWPWAEYRLTGDLPTRAGNGQANIAPAADVIPTADGTVVLSAYTREHFARLCDVVGRADLSTDPRFSDNAGRVANRAALLSELRSAMAGFRTRDLCDRLGRAGVVVGAVRSLADIVPGRDGVSADLFIDVSAPKRKTPSPLPGQPFTLDGARRGAGRLPGLGEHTDAMLAALSRGAPWPAC